MLGCWVAWLLGRPKGLEQRSAWQPSDLVTRQPDPPARSSPPTLTARSGQQAGALLPEPFRTRCACYLLPAGRASPSCHPEPVNGAGRAAEEAMNCGGQAILPVRSRRSEARNGQAGLPVPHQFIRRHWDDTVGAFARSLFLSLSRRERRGTRLRMTNRRLASVARCAERG